MKSKVQDEATQPVESDNVLYRSSASFADSKPHYVTLDGLRGSAALLVLVYHVFEGLAFAAGADLIVGLNHGYLAVDFFFLLSGFVIGYAYDDRLKGSMTTGNFIRRRLIRLHPMIVMGALVGVVAFLVQGSVHWDGSHVALGWVFLALFCSMLFIPALPGTRLDVRGNGEMFPLNGPSWSLFFEYIGNLCYVLFIHKLSTRALGWLAFVLGLCLAAFSLFDLSGYGMLGVGWTLEGNNFVGGLLRMLFPYTLGMWLARGYKPGRSVRGAFWLCSLIMLCLFTVPYIAGKSPICWNAVFEMACLMVIFPCILLVGASSQPRHKLSLKACKWVGDLSYPLYAIHYPVMYVFYAWLIDNHRYTLAEAWPQALLAVGVSIVLAMVCLKLYDEPVRRWLMSHWLHKDKR